MQWMFGDWSSLAALDIATVEQSADRAGIAVLVGSAHQHLGDRELAERFLRVAQSWGAHKRSIARILTSDVHNSLACSAVLANDWTRAMSHFREAVKGVSGDERLACQARIVRELARLDYLRQAGRILRDGIDGLQPAGTASLDRRLGMLQGPQAELGAASPVDTSIREPVQSCLDADDFHECVDAYLHDDSMPDTDKFAFCVEVSDRLYEQGDRVSGLHFLSRASDFVSSTAIIGERQRSELARKLAGRGRQAEAIELMVTDSIDRIAFDATEQKKLRDTFDKVWRSYQDAGKHGHQLLIEFLDRESPAGRDDGGRVMIEVGSTRESVPGQGSTAELAECAKRHSLHFITVDMDPHNTAAAAECIRGIDATYRAIAAKGEDFLEAYEGLLDYVFLDAYDFDHGGHSELRQSRYKRFLGEQINDEACHRMHLECAQALLVKLSDDGVICIDDTWQDDSGAWTAKGTLAVPYLLENGFTVVQARNRAVLMRRQ